MDKYQKIRVLGKGSFGSATLVKRKADSQLFVAKEVSLSKMSQKEREEARHEVKILQTLQHPNIVRFVEHVESRGILYIVMEYADGGDLHQKIKNQRNTRMKEETILHYFAQLALALDYLHSKHILHRDIKAMNVFLTSKGTVKVGDFGISTVLRNTMGLANTVCGTPYYFSPELCRNKPYNNKSDVWALGVVLYEMAALKHPFDANNMNQLMQRITKSPYQPISSAYSSEMRSLITRCLEKDHTQRPTVRQLLQQPIMRTALAKLEQDLTIAAENKLRLQVVVADGGVPLSRVSEDPIAALEAAKKADREAAAFGKPLPQPITPPPKQGEPRPSGAMGLKPANNMPIAPPPPQQNQLQRDAILAAAQAAAAAIQQQRPQQPKRDVSPSNAIGPQRLFFGDDPRHQQPLNIQKEQKNAAALAAEAAKVKAAAQQAAQIVRAQQLANQREAPYKPGGYLDPSDREALKEIEQMIKHFDRPAREVQREAEQKAVQDRMKREQDLLDKLKKEREAAAEREREGQRKAAAAAANAARKAAEREKHIAELAKVQREMEEKYRQQQLKEREALRQPMFPRKEFDSKPDHRLEPMKAEPAAGRRAAPPPSVAEALGRRDLSPQPYKMQNEPMNVGLKEDPFTRPVGGAALPGGRRSPQAQGVNVVGRIAVGNYDDLPAVSEQYLQKVARGDQIAKAGNWVQREQDRKRNYAYKQLLEEREAVKQLPNISPPLGPLHGPTPQQFNPAVQQQQLKRQVIDPELEQWVQRQERKIYPSPPPEGLPPPAHPRQQQQLNNPRLQPDVIRRSVDEADRVLRQQRGLPSVPQHLPTGRPAGMFGAQARDAFPPVQQMRSATPPPSPCRLPLPFQQAPKLERSPGQRDPALKLLLDENIARAGAVEKWKQPPTQQQVDLWARRQGSNPNAAPQGLDQRPLLGLDQIQNNQQQPTGRNRRLDREGDSSQEGAPPRGKKLQETRQYRERSAPPAIYSPNRYGPISNLSPAKELEAQTDFNEVPVSQLHEGKRRQSQALDPSEFPPPSDEDEEGDEDLEEMEAISGSGDAERQAEYDQMRSHILTILSNRHGSNASTPRTGDIPPNAAGRLGAKNKKQQQPGKKTSSTEEASIDDVIDLVDNDDEEFGDDVLPSPGKQAGQDLFVAEDDMFRLAHLCGDRFTGDMPVKFDGSPLFSASGNVHGVGSDEEPTNGGKKPKHGRRKSQGEAAADVELTGPSFYAGKLRAHLEATLGTNVVQIIYKLLCKIDATKAKDQEIAATPHKFSEEQRILDNARERLSSVFKAKAHNKGARISKQKQRGQDHTPLFYEPEDDVALNDDIEQYLSFLCQLIYFDETAAQRP